MNERIGFMNTRNEIEEKIVILENLENLIQKANFVGTPFRYKRAVDHETDDIELLVCEQKGNKLIKNVKGSNNAYSFLEGVVMATVFILLGDNKYN